MSVRGAALAGSSILGPKQEAGLTAPTHLTVQGTWLQVQPDPGFQRYCQSFLCPSSSGLPAHPQAPGFPFVRAADTSLPPPAPAAAQQRGLSGSPLPHTPGIPGPGVPPQPQHTPYAGGEPPGASLTQAQFLGCPARSRHSVGFLATDREDAQAGRPQVTLPGWVGAGQQVGTGCGEGQAEREVSCPAFGGPWRGAQKEVHSQWAVRCAGP